MHFQPILLLTVLAIQVHAQQGKPGPGHIGFFLATCKDKDGNFDEKSTENACFSWGGDAHFISGKDNNSTGKKPEPVCQSASSSLEPSKWDIFCRGAGAFQGTAPAYGPWN